MCTNSGVVQPADVRAPGPGVETVLVGVVEAALERGLRIGLRQSAKDVLAVDAEVARQRVIGLGRFGLCLRRLGRWRGHLSKSRIG